MRMAKAPREGHAQNGQNDWDNRHAKVMMSPLSRQFSPIADSKQSTKDDQSEKAADHTASRVVSGGAPDVQRETERHANKGAPGLVDDTISGMIQSEQGTGRKLSTGLPDNFEKAFGPHLNRVRIHDDEKANELSKSLNARAFTHQNDIFFRKGEYQTGSKEGQELLAHELTHTVQQGGGGTKSSSVNSIQLKESNEVDNSPKFELERDKSSSVALGTTVTYSLEKGGTDDLAWGYNYVWKVIDAKGSTFYTTTSVVPYITLKATVPGDYVVQAQVLKGDEWVDQAYLDQNVYYKETHTDLGGLFVGNFDYKYDGNSVDVETRFTFKFESGTTKTEKADFKKKFFEAIESYWTNAGVSFVSKGDCPVDEIPLNITAKEDDSDYHKEVDVVRNKIRPDVVYDMNLYLGISKKTIAHEYGHVLGLYDEYPAPWYEDLWHDTKHESDSDALMHTGTQQRRRYFTRFLSTTNKYTPEGCSFKLKTPFSK